MNTNNNNGRFIATNSTDSDPESYQGTNMFIDNTSLPFNRYLIDFNNSRIQCHDEVIESIPKDYPPKFYQYIDGTKHFIISRRDDRYPVAIFDRERVRLQICSDPVRWEEDGIDACIAVEQYHANERGDNGNFWLLYLPFLDRLDYGHERIDYSTYSTYGLREAEGRLVYECDLTEVIDHWSNVRTNQWSFDAQQKVDHFLRNIQRAEGWEDGNWDHYRRNREAFRPTNMDDATAVQPNPDNDAASDTPHVEDADESYYRPGTMGSNSDDDGRRDDDESSDGFSDDISDIENNLGAYRITPPGAIRPVQYADGTRDDDEYEWTKSSPVGERQPQIWVGGRNEANSDDYATRNDQHGSPDHDNRSTDGIQPYTITDSNDDVEPTRPTESISVREFKYRGETIQYTIIAGYPWFYFGSVEDNIRHENMWRQNILYLPDVRSPEPDDLIRKYDPEIDDGSDDGRGSVRCDTPYEESPYEQDDS